MLISLGAPGANAASPCAGWLSNDFQATRTFWKTATVQAVTSCLATSSPNDRDEFGWTPLHWAARNSTPAIITALLAAGADARAKDQAGKRPIDYAKDNKALVGSDASYTKESNP